MNVLRKIPDALPVRWSNRAVHRPITRQVITPTVHHECETPSYVARPTYADAKKNPQTQEKRHGSHRAAHVPEVDRHRRDRVENRRNGGYPGLGASAGLRPGRPIHWLRWNDFVPASDEMLRKEIVPAGEKALGVKLTLETINGNDIQARTTSAIQSGSGPDVICGLNNWPQLYAESVVDVSDIAEEIGKAQEGFYKKSTVVANDGKKWIAVPWCVLGAQIAYRKSWFEEIGFKQVPGDLGGVS